MDSERNYFPKMEVATDEEWQKLQPMLDKAKAEGNPWAFTAGIGKIRTRVPDLLPARY